MNTVLGHMAGYFKFLYFRKHLSLHTYFFEANAIFFSFKCKTFSLVGFKKSCLIVEHHQRAGKAGHTLGWKMNVLLNKSASFTSK